MEVRAILRNVRTSPQKAALVADLIRGKNVNNAVNILQFSAKKSAGIFQKLLKSAIANAEENHKALDVDDLVITKVTVNQGPTWKRNMPRARGMATPIKKRTSHLMVALEEKA